MASWRYNILFLSDKFFHKYGFITKGWNPGSVSIAFNNILTVDNIFLLLIEYASTGKAKMGIL